MQCDKYRVPVDEGVEWGLGTCLFSPCLSNLQPLPDITDAGRVHTPILTSPPFWPTTTPNHRSLPPCWHAEQITTSLISQFATFKVGIAKGLGVEPPVYVYRRSFWVKIGFKFQSLGKISNISTSAPPSCFRSIPTLATLRNSIRPNSNWLDLPGENMLRKMRGQSFQWKLIWPPLKVSPFQFPHLLGLVPFLLSAVGEAVHAVTKSHSRSQSHVGRNSQCCTVVL